MRQKENIAKTSWFKGGLRFECNNCGACCVGRPGVVWVNEEEITAIANFLKLPVDKFSKKYIRKIFDRYSLTEYKNGDCIMYDEGCKIYKVRPYQCSSFPFWLVNLETEEEWNSLKDFCPGINQGKLYSSKKIIDIASVREY